MYDRNTLLKISLSPKAVTIILGITGLVPFVFSTLWALVNIVNYIPILVFSYYSAGILCFLAGSLWSQTEQSVAMLIQSNAITLLAVFALIAFHFEQKYCLFLLLTGFVWMLYLDLANADYEYWYKKLRLVLSGLVFLMHITLIVIE